ncbi:5'-methylthioadenosine/S-adenosylhomocysteine nucleosidase [Candidatus Uhrbacteria bacterium]|nr:5'-methylthioadenosine/S-adenosylhomocysteine nucleosidase [Candidatus Uhrbacteria bacterium]
MRHLEVIAAMEDEIAGLCSTCTRDPVRDGFTIRKSGVGKVNAALAVADAARWDPLGIIVVGTAGALAPDLRRGDVVVVNSAMQHDVDASALDAQRFPRGMIPFEPTSTWYANAPLVAAAEQVLRDLDARHTIGGICSGERFLADATEKRFLHEHFHGACIDMETGAIAQACAKFQIPWVGIRIMSDGADHDAGAQFTTSLPVASASIARIIPRLVIAAIAALAHVPGSP